jgi:hypothetical protein
MGWSGAPNNELDGNTVFEIGSITKVVHGARRSGGDRLA